MVGKLQISISLAYVAVTVTILLAGPIKAKPVYKNGRVHDPKLESILKDMIETTHRVKQKAIKIGGSPLVHHCEKDFGVSEDNLKKALDLYKKGISTQEGFNELEAYVKEAENAYRTCDRVFAEQYQPSPFSVYNTWLKDLAVKAEKEAETDEEIA